MWEHSLVSLGGTVVLVDFLGCNVTHLQGNLWEHPQAIRGVHLHGWSTLYGHFVGQIPRLWDVWEQFWLSQNANLEGVHMALDNRLAFEPTTVTKCFGRTFNRRAQSRWSN